MVDCLFYVGVFMICGLVSEFAYRWRAGYFQRKREKMLSDISRVALVGAVLAFVAFTFSLIPLM